MKKDAASHSFNIVHASQLLTLANGDVPRRGRALRELSIIKDGAVSIRDGIIQWAGHTDQLPDKAAQAFHLEGQGERADRRRAMRFRRTLMRKVMRFRGNLIRSGGQAQKFRVRPMSETEMG